MCGSSTTRSRSASSSAARSGGRHRGCRCGPAMSLLVVTNDVSARDVQLPKTQFFEAKSYPDVHAGRSGPARPRAGRLRPLRDLSALGQRRPAPGQHGGRHDLPPAGGAPALARFPLDTRPRPDGDAGRHGPHGTPARGRGHRVDAPRGHQVEGFFNRQAGNRKYPGRRRRRGDDRHSRRALELGRQTNTVRAHDMNDTTIGTHSVQPQPDPNTLWPDYSSPDDLTTIEAQPLSTRGLPETTYDVLRRAPACGRTARRSPPCPRRPAGMRAHPAPTPSCSRTSPGPRTCCTRATRRRGRSRSQRRRADHGALLAQVAGVAAPINAGLSAEHIVELLKDPGPGARVPDRGSTPAVDPRVGGRQRRRHRSPGAARTGRAGAGRHPMRPGSSSSPKRQRQSRRRSSRRPPRADDIAALFHTGGTTGRPSWRRTPTRTRWSTHGPSPRSRSLDDDSVIFAGLPSST